MPRVALIRGDVVFVDLSGAIGNEKQGWHPCLVVQNDGGNRASPLTIVAPITDARQYKGYPQQVPVEGRDLGLGGKDSVIECGHVRSIDRDARIDDARGVWCHLSQGVLARVDDALRASLALAA
jgi:mRNA interferase MazF